MPGRPLQALGWRPFFQQQLTLDDLETFAPARVFEVQRSGMLIVGEALEHNVPLGGRWYQLPAVERPTVGDWVLVDHAGTTVQALLERASLIKRLAPSGELQAIAANLDTVFVVTSANDDFNLSRTERYLALAGDAGIEAVVVITKIDLSDDPAPFEAAAQTLTGAAAVVAVNALDPVSAQALAPWCGQGQTVGLLGSSGVGKSTLVNLLMGDEVQATQSIREDDAKGRHTTTHRSLHRLPGGALVLDSPGMREIQLADVAEGVRDAFEDVESLAADCRFRDCQHAGEPGCAVQIAIDAGNLDERRLANYRKLLREERHNSETVAQRHARMRQFGRMVKSHVDAKRRDR